MERTIETLRTSFNSIRTGRANVAMLDKIEVYIKPYDFVNIFIHVFYYAKLTCFWFSRLNTMEVL